MKRLISLLVSSLFLFVVNRVETTYTYSIIETPSKSANDAPALPQSVARPYQHLRFCGDDVVIVEHDVLEATIVWLRLPKSVAQGALLPIHQAPYRVKILQDGQTYWTVSGQITVIQHTTTTDGEHFLRGTIEGIALDAGQTDTLQVATSFETRY